MLFCNRDIGSAYLYSIYLLSGKENINLHQYVYFQFDLVIGLLNNKYWNFDIILTSPVKYLCETGCAYLLICILLKIGLSTKTKYYLNELTLTCPCSVYHQFRHTKSVALPFQCQKCNLGFDEVMLLQLHNESCSKLQ